MTKLTVHQVVDDPSSCLGDSSLEETRYIASNHMEMCRFTGALDTEYQKVCAAFDRIAQNVGKESANTASSDSLAALPLTHRETAGTEDKSTAESASLQAFLDSLWHHTIGARYVAIKPAHTRTCRWFLEKSEYKDWLSAEQVEEHDGILWIKGKPGSGKSTLIKYAVANAQKEHEGSTVISFFFNSRGEDLEKTTTGMYRSLLHSLLKEFPDLLAAMPQSRSKDLSNIEPYHWEDAELQQLFAAAVRLLGRRQLICFIDALDECEEDEIRELVSFLSRLGQNCTQSQIYFRACLSSRHYPHISIDKAIGMILENEEHHDDDITKYVNSALKAGRGNQVERIKNEILRRSSGIFLWVVLVVQILNKQYDHGRIHALETRLKAIPDGLDELFEDILTRDRENMQELVLCIQWILYAVRPLRREEFYYAVLSGAEPENLHTIVSEEITPEDMDRFVLSCSKGFAEVTKNKAKIVQFIHESVREYFMNKNAFDKLRFDLSPGVSNEHLKVSCYTYMRLDMSKFLPIPILSELPVASSKAAIDLRESAQQKLPFLDYAVRTLLHHADASDGFGVSQTTFVETFALDLWIFLDNLLERYQIRRHTPAVPLLYILAEKNLSDLARIEVCRDQDPTTAGERDGAERYPTPLSVAINNENCNRQMLQALLMPGTRFMTQREKLHSVELEKQHELQQTIIDTIIREKPRIGKSEGYKLIHWAILQRQEIICRWLLSERPGNLDYKDKKGRTGLHHAGASGQERLVNELLSSTSNPDLQDLDGRTPLSYAAAEGHDTVVEVLLAKGANPDSRDAFRETPLSYAAENGHQELVKILLARNVNPDAKSNTKRTPLSYAAKHGHQEIMKMLLARNVDPDPKCMIRTPLSYAAEYGHQEIVKVLLARNVDPDSKGDNNRTPLSYAAKHGHEEIVKILLARNVDPDSEDDNKRTPLSYAAEQGHQETVKFLLASIADPTLMDIDGHTPLSYAARAGSESIVEILLSKNVKPRPRRFDAKSPLLEAAERGHEQIMQLLISMNANATFTSKHRSTALSLATRKGHKGAVKVLLSHKVEMDRATANEEAPLKIALENKYDGIAELLLWHGACSEPLWTHLQYLLDRGDGHKDRTTQILSLEALRFDFEKPECMSYFNSALKQGVRSVVDILVHNWKKQMKPIDPDLLCFAAKSGNVRVIKLLLSEGANPSESDSQGKTPLHWAAIQGSRDMVDVLLAHGSNLNAIDDDDHTALYYARLYVHESVVSFLEGPGLMSEEWKYLADWGSASPATDYPFQLLNDKDQSS